MRQIVLNDYNLTDQDINEKEVKCRAIFINNGKILVANYGGIYLLPGGKVEQKESVNDAIIRELKEEIGKKITDLKLTYVIKYYQKDYPKRDGRVLNRLIETYYYTSNKKIIINWQNQSLTQNELMANFHLEWLEIDKLKNYLNNDNPRSKYFNREINEVLNQKGKIYEKKRI